MSAFGVKRTWRDRRWRIDRSLMIRAFRGGLIEPAILTIHFARPRDIGAIRTISKRDGMAWTASVAC